MVVVDVPGTPKDMGERGKNIAVTTLVPAHEDCHEMGMSRSPGSYGSYSSNQSTPPSKMSIQTSLPHGDALAVMACRHQLFQPRIMII